MIYRRSWQGWLFTAPALIFVVAFVAAPFLLTLRSSLFDLDILGGVHGAWVGLENYVSMVGDVNMRIALVNTVKLLLCTIVLQGGIAFVLALLVSRLRRGASLYQVIYFFPMVISASALGLLFNLLYVYPNGPLNQIWSALGGDPVIWKGDPGAFVSILIPVVWNSVGFYFVIFLMGIRSISTELTEAAELDGASQVRVTRSIIIPLMRNHFITALVLQISGALRVFDLPWILLPNGQPQGTTYLTGTYMYQMTFVNRDVDYGASIAVVIVVLGVLLSVMVNRGLRRSDA